MTNNQWTEFRNWSILIAFVIFAVYCLIADPLLNYIYLKTDSAYTISNDVYVGTTTKAGNESKYTFYLNGKWYSGYTSLPLRWDGTKYFIQFYPKNPNRNKATTIEATPEDTKNMPVGGYKILPHE